MESRGGEGAPGGWAMGMRGEENTQNKRKEKESARVFCVGVKTEAEHKEVQYFSLFLVKSTSMLKRGNIRMGENKKIKGE